MIRSVRVCIAETTECGIAYAQWKSAEQREQAFESELNIISEANQKMREAIEEDFPEIKLEIVSDYLLMPERC